MRRGLTVATFRSARRIVTDVVGGLPPGSAHSAVVSREDSDMIKAIMGVVVGFLIWFMAATLGNMLVRVLIPNYVAAEAAMAFTLPMLLARLAVGGLSSIAAGFAFSYIAARSRKAVYVLALILVLFFLPVHYALLARFPIWYHVAFLGTLAPLIIAGGALRAPRHAPAPP
jgi:hypothetical protein